MCSSDIRHIKGHWRWSTGASLILFSFSLQALLLQRYRLITILLDIIIYNFMIKGFVVIGYYSSHHHIIAWELSCSYSLQVSHHETPYNENFNYFYTMMNNIVQGWGSCSLLCSARAGTFALLRVQAAPGADWQFNVVLSNKKSDGTFVFTLMMRGC